MRPFVFKLVLFVIFLSNAFSCGGADVCEGEDYGNLLLSPSGLTLVEEEHIGGWGRSECTMCHNLENIHLVNRTGIPIDIDAIHELTLEQGVASCPACHGDNGVP